MTASNRQSGFVSSSLLAVIFTVATFAGAFAPQYPDDECSCEWKGTWNGAGFGGYTCSGVCTAGCSVWNSVVVPGSMHCWCTGGTNKCNCYGLAVVGGSGDAPVITGVDCYSNTCNNANEDCISPDQSTGWNGQVGGHR